MNVLYQYKKLSDYDPTCIYRSGNQTRVILSGGGRYLKPVDRAGDYYAKLTGPWELECISDVFLLPEEEAGDVRR